MYSLPKHCQTAKINSFSNHHTICKCDPVVDISVLLINSPTTILSICVCVDNMYNIREASIELNLDANEAKRFIWTIYMCSQQEPV